MAIVKSCALEPSGTEVESADEKAYLYVRNSVVKSWHGKLFFSKMYCMYLDLRSALIFDVDEACAEASEFAPKANKRPTKWKEAMQQLKKGSSP